jgi:hypothetical protein
MAGNALLEEKYVNQPSFTHRLRNEKKWDDRTMAQMARTQRVGAIQETDIAGTAMTGVRSAPF